MTRHLIRLILILLLLGTLAVAWQWSSNPANRAFLSWARGSTDTLITVQREKCAGAPFILPSDGFIGLLFADPRGPYSRLRPHQGIDIFTDQDPGVTPVYAAYDGYVTRADHWTSALIQRVPSDPLNPAQQIWLYYSHMADEQGIDYIEPAFERGVSEIFVQQGTLLGYVGNYDGNTPSRIWTHLHFSIVKDGGGIYLNELDINNTLDPTLYLGMSVNHADSPPSPITCIN